jgi:hypothetical protein
MPANHGPLGPLKPTEANRGPPPPESSARWRTNLARGSEARAYEAPEGDHATRMLAFMVQQAMDEYKAGNRDFGVSTHSTVLPASHDCLWYRPSGLEEHFLSPTAQWICSPHLFMSLLTKP